MEGLLPQDRLGHHHHAGDPEEQDILTGDEDVAREVFHRLVFSRPAKGAERPKAGGEPCVEDVRVAPDREDQNRWILGHVVFCQACREAIKRFGLIGHFDDFGVA